MNENLNLVKILKDCPEGFELYSSVHGEVKFVKCIDLQMVIVKKGGEYYYFTQKGVFLFQGILCEGECTLFPSKDLRDWSKFTAPWYKNERDTIDCLGKQGESSPILSNSSNIGKNEQKSADKIEPKFKVGNWVVFNGFTLYIKEVVKGFYRTISKGGIVNSYDWDIDNIARLWVIQDAKDGDVICYRDEISLYKHDIKNCTKQETTFGGFVYYCCYDGKRFITDSFYILTKQDKMDIHPATKEQRDALMKAMNDAGYVWDVEKKELRGLIKHKFDPNTLQVFDKVLARMSNESYNTWYADFVAEPGYTEDETPLTIGAKEANMVIPYNDDTKHLVGTTEEAPEYYRYWEE